jgi:hypothetical protein
MTEVSSHSQAGLFRICGGRGVEGLHSCLSVEVVVGIAGLLA